MAVKVRAGILRTERRLTGHVGSFYTQSTSCGSVSSVAAGSCTRRNKIPHQRGSGGCGQRISSEVGQQPPVSQSKFPVSRSWRPTVGMSLLPMPSRTSQVCCSAPPCFCWVSRSTQAPRRPAKVFLLAEKLLALKGEMLCIPAGFWTCRARGRLLASRHQPRGHAHFLFHSLCWRWRNKGPCFDAGGLAAFMSKGPRAKTKL